MAGMNMEYIIYGLMGISILLLLLVIILMVRVSSITKRYNAFMAGENAASLEEQIAKNYKEMQTIRLKQEQQDLDILEISDRVDGAFCRMGMVKYDAFTGLGGKLSFAITVLNEKKDGYVLNCMQSNQTSYVYSKEVKHGTCEVKMSPEEEESLKIALK